MGLRKPSNIPKLEEILSEETSPENEIRQILESVEAFGTEKVDKNILQQLTQTETYYPVIPVQDKCLLLAVISKSFKGLVWLSNWFEVDSAYRNKNDVYRVRFKINDRIIEVDYDTLYPKDIIKLSKYGLIINFDYANYLSKYIFRILAKLDVQEQSNSMGFIMQDGISKFRAYDEEPQILQYTPNVELSGYVEGLNSLLTNTAVMFALCCSCASMFLAYLGMKCSIPLMSFIISFYGKTTTGKSTAQALMTSVFTNPNDKKLYIPFFGTLNAIVKNFSCKFGIPQLFDEATVSSGLNMENLLYTITLEQDKSRCNTNADLRQADTWKLIAITSSENRLLSDSQMHNKGLDARLLSFELKFTDNRQHSDNIHEFCNKNYGVLGKALSEYLLSADPETIVGLYEECRESIRHSLDEAEYFDLTERLVNEYALILLSAKVLTDFGVCIDIKGITDIMTKNHGEIQERTDIAEKYYQHLLSYVIMHPYAEGVKKDESNHTIALIDELFVRILENYGASNVGLVVKELDAAGYIFRRKKNSIKNRLRFGNSLMNCYEIILPEDDLASDEGCMSLEYILTHFEGLDES